MSGRKRKRATAADATADELKETVRTLTNRMEELEKHVKELSSTYLEYVLQEARLRQIDNTTARLQERVEILSRAQCTTTETIELVWYAHMRLRYEYDMHIVPTEPSTPDTVIAQVSDGPLILTAGENISDLY